MLPVVSKTSATSAVIAVRHLTKRFGAVIAVSDVSFTVARHETVVLWGANGAGKTTMLRCLLGVIPYDGAIDVLGCDVRTRGKQARASLGYVPQEIRLHSESTVWETAQFYARLRRAPVARAAQLLEQWQLSDARRRPVRNLSGGMKQKLAIVVALLADPPILLLDEPTSNLDVQARRDFSMLLEQLKQSGKTMLCCLHQIGDVWKIADRIVVLDRGQNIREGTPAEVAATIGERIVVCVTIAREHTAAAAQLLERDGFAVERNGMQLWIRVEAGHKVEPVQRLVAAGIPLLDLAFDEGP